MTSLKHTIKINTSKERIWNILTNLEEVSKYNKSIKSARYISENRSGIGASRECVMDKGQKLRERVTHVDPGLSIHMEMYESDWPLKFMHWKTAITDNDDSSVTLSQVTEYEPGMGFLGKIMNFLMMKRKFNQILSELFTDLKHYAETKEYHD